MEGSKLVVAVNKKATTSLDNSIVFTEDGHVYLSIRDVAAVYGYGAYSGEYYNKSEQSGKCYIESDIQSVDFEVNSKKIFRVAHQATYNQTEELYLQYPIQYIDGDMYINILDMENAMYISASYDASTNIISLSSLEYYIALYTTEALKYGFTEFDLKYENTVALLDGILIGKNNDKVGAIDLNTGAAILETKYDDITYLRSMGEFMVKSSGKYGIITVDKVTKVELSYDDIDILDGGLGLYVVKKDSRYGILDKTGSTKVYPEYEQIGVDLRNFEENNIENKYLLGNDLIPLKKDGEWGFINLDYKVVTDFEFTSLGYLHNVSSSSVLNLLVIKDYDVIVVEKDEKYSLVGPDGTVLYAIAFEKVYMTTKNGYEEFYIEYDGDVYDAADELEKRGLEVVE